MEVGPPLGHANAGQNIGHARPAGRDRRGAVGMPEERLYDLRAEVSQFAGETQDKPGNRESPLGAEKVEGDSRLFQPHGQNVPPGRGSGHEHENMGLKFVAAQAQGQFRQHPLGATWLQIGDAEGDAMRIGGDERHGTRQHDT